MLYLGWVCILGPPISKLSLPRASLGLSKALAFHVTDPSLIGDTQQVPEHYQE